MVGFSHRPSTLAQAAALLAELEYLDREDVAVATLDELADRLVERWQKDPRNVARAQNLLDSVDELRDRLQASHIDLWLRPTGEHARQATTSRQRNERSARRGTPVVSSAILRAFPVL